MWLRKTPVVYSGLLIWLDRERLFRFGGRVTVCRWRITNDQRITKPYEKRGA